MILNRFGADVKAFVAANVAALVEADCVAFQFAPGTPLQLTGLGFSYVLTADAWETAARVVVFAGVPKVGLAALAQLPQSAAFGTTADVRVLLDVIGLESGTYHPIDIPSPLQYRGEQLTALVCWPYAPLDATFSDAVVSLTAFGVPGAMDAAATADTYGGKRLRPS